MRHAIVHGALSSGAANDGEFIFMKLNAGYDTHFVNEFIFRPSEFAKIVRDLLDLGADAGKLGHNIFDIVKQRP
jgi:hypothetical protein